MNIRTRANSTGFSLIELMVTVAIVAILGTIAMVSYRSQIMKSRRTDARSAVLDLAGREEKLFSMINAYSATAADMGYTALPATIGSGYYTVNVTINNPANPPSYLITATAIGSQASDTTCATLSIDQLGNQTATPAANASTCWGN
jgi:type IV pilus assembly protein PilE